MPKVSDANWENYYRQTSGRAPRALVTDAASLFSTPGTALDLGSGDGTESLWLLRNGWNVIAVDNEPNAAKILQQQAPIDAPLTVETADLHQYQPPQADLIISWHTLPFLSPSGFENLWQDITARLTASGVIAVTLFGNKDSWASGPSRVEGMTFHARPTVEQLLAGLRPIRLVEHEYDGASGRGPKHWHYYDIIARHRQSDNRHE